MRRGLMLAVLALLCLAVLAGCAFGGSEGTAETKREELRVTVLKVGKADAILLWVGDEAVLLDTGEEDDGEEILEYIQQQGLKQLKAMIITHFDKDHVGGADKVLENCIVEQVYFPDYEGDGKQYRQFAEALDASSAERIPVTGRIEIKMGDASVGILASALEPEEILAGGEEEYDNDLSLAVRLVYGEDTMLFLGDAKEQRIEELLTSGEDLSCDILKMPHHGRYHNGLPELLEAAHPDDAVICCSDKNPAEEETLALLKEQGITAWKTQDGNIEISGRGEGWTIRQN